MECGIHKGQTNRGVMHGPSIVLNTEIMNYFQRNFNTKHYIFTPNDSEGIVDQLAHLLDKCRWRTVGTPIYIGGDHSITMATAPPTFDTYGSKHTAHIHIDAHLDLHTPETTPSGNYHGMCVAALLGMMPEIDWCYNSPNKLLPKNLAFVGTRSYEQEEQDLVNDLGIKVFTSGECDHRNIKKTLRGLSNFLEDKEHIHVSFDVDVLDPSVFPWTGTTVPNGVMYREIMMILDLLKNTGKVRSMDIVEVNPMLAKDEIEHHVACILTNYILRRLFD